MLCQFERLLYPPDAKSVNAGSYMVAVYKPCESIIDGKGNMLSRVKAVGYGLPLSAQLRYDMKGQWNKDPKFGICILRRRHKKGYGHITKIIRNYM